MAKLNCYCINSVASYFNVRLIMMDKIGYKHIPYEQWTKLRMHIIYNFEDRYDNGYSLNKAIEVFSKTKYRFAYEFLKKLRDTMFEDHKVTKVSDGLLISLMSAKPNSNIYLKRYYVKQFKKLRILLS